MGNAAETKPAERSRAVGTFRRISPSEIEISGLDVVLDRGSKFARRVIWAFILVVCFGLMLAQCLDRLFTFLSGPIAVTIQVIRNESLIFPAVTICSNIGEAVDRFDGNRVEDLWNREFGASKYPGIWKATRILSEKLGSAEFWKLATYNISSIIASVLLSRTHSTSHVNNLMVHIEVHVRVEKAIDREDGERGKTEETWSVIVHMQQDLPIVSACMQGEWFRKNQDKYIGVSIRNNASFVQPRLSLPFVRNTPARACKGGEEFMRASNLSIRMLDGRDRNIPTWNPEKCGCHMPCKHIMYEFSSDTRDRQDNHSVTRVFYRDMTYEEIVEKHSYDIISLLCDLGGTLGLLLGASEVRVFGDEGVNVCLSVSTFVLQCHIHLETVVLDDVVFLKLHSKMERGAPVFGNPADASRFIALRITDPAFDLKSLEIRRGGSSPSSPQATNGDEISVLNGEGLGGVDIFEITIRYRGGKTTELQSENGVACRQRDLTPLVACGDEGELPPKSDIESETESVVLRGAV
ncbi:unnamed protein product [Darwinula stevensoni]|uniref:Uncharacterized protein n=1 Tax=Darwinula stevensoni TaxID=69355 RepID=A0A7R9ADQ6_9CRUS|nr:unnamed protein product [Darwinula stevensoni]CAG0901539.1 unnamed protein product [Darwinula stevensoni]